MATPFFRGNYGSALGRVDTRPIIEAGRAQGQMFAQAGAQIGNMIQQYGLNKQKQKENKNTIKSSVGILKRLQQIDPENAVQYETQIEQLNNEDIGLRERAGLADKTLQGISITGQMESNMLRNKSVADSLKSTQDSRNAVKGAFAQMNKVLEEAKQAQTEAREAGLPFEFTPTVQRMFDNPQIIKAGMESGDASLLGSFISDPAMDRIRQAEARAKEIGADTAEKLQDPTVTKAKADAKMADVQASFAESIASAEFANKIGDARLTAAQENYYNAKTKAEADSDRYKTGEKVRIKSDQGDTVEFIWTGNSLQPLNNKISKKTVDEAIIRNVDFATLKVYLDDTYDFDEDTQTYTYDEGEEQNPMMEQAITIMGLRDKIKPDEETATPVATTTESLPVIQTQEEFDRLPSGSIYTGKDGRKRRKP